MEQDSISFAKYWRNNLTDVALQGGEFDPSALVRVSRESWSKGRLDADAVKLIFDKIDKPGQKEEDLIPSVEILGYASVYVRETRHGLSRRDGVPRTISTIMVRASVNRDGLLTAELNPYIPRMLLEPLEYSRFFVGGMDELDAFLAKASWSNSPTWSDLTHRCTELELSVCDQSILDLKQFLKHEEVYLAVVDAKAMGASAGIISLYDDMVNNEQLDVPLFDTFASHDASATMAIPSADSTISLRSGHMEPGYPLADAQRDSLSVAMTSKAGQIVAVNGPPGTGKTTLIQSVVASRWVDSAMKGEDYPPVIVAASTNNQAVTNVIDSFGKVNEKNGDQLAGRWLPDLMSFGCYYPAGDKLAGARERGYQTEDFMENLETLKYVSTAEKAYVETASRVFETSFTEVNEVIGTLHNRITEHHKFSMKPKIVGIDSRALCRRS